VDSRNPPKNLAEKRAASPVRQRWPLMGLQQKLIGAGVMRRLGNSVEANASSNSPAGLFSIWVIVN
jgi:hypothetical protein